MFYSLFRILGDPRGRKTLFLSNRSCGHGPPEDLLSIKKAIFMCRGVNYTRKIVGPMACGAKYSTKIVGPMACGAKYSTKIVGPMACGAKYSTKIVDENRCILWLVARNIR